VKQHASKEEESIMHPQIDEMSKRLVEEKMADRKNKSTHERLYELNKEKQEKLRQKQNEAHNEYVK
jgi:hypothetical protein